MTRTGIPRAHPASAPPGAGLPLRAGIGLKPCHLPAILEGDHRVAFFEVHAENYMGAGGPAHRRLAEVCERWPLSAHGVGLSLGGADRPDPEHLARLRDLCERYRPRVFSEHLAWSGHGGVFYNDLLPLPYDGATLARLAAHVNETQDALRRRILIENPSTYLGFDGATMDEVAFLAELARRTGCGLLLDVNNVYVSAVNRGFDADAYIDAFPVERVEEIHLAGFATDAGPGPRLLIDDHGAAIDRDVWRLFERAIARIGSVPVLIERDNDIPPFQDLAAEAARAEAVLDRAAAAARGAA